MLTATINSQTGEIETTGTVEVGDIYTGYCCAGHDWEVRIIFPDNNPNYISIWGCCHNPDCPVIEPGMTKEEDHYHGVSNIEVGDFAERLANQAAEAANGR